MSSDQSQVKKGSIPLVTVRASSSFSSEDSLKIPRTPRFFEATTVYSPVEPQDRNRSPFDDPRPTQQQPQRNSYMAQAQPADVGFGYLSDSRQDQGIPIEMPQTPGSPLKSAMRLQGAPKRAVENPLSPTFREEEVLEKREQMTDKEQAKDLLVKTRVRIAKVALRITNFSCSLIVLAMISTTLHIVFATRHLPAQNSLPAWAVGTKTWPQIVVLVIACISLAFCLAIFYGYWRGGHRRAEKTAVYYTLFAVGFFIFSIVMWALAAGILQGARSGGNNKDVWGWSCVDNKRRELFQDKVDYALVCRLQSWSLICCIIEVVVETLTILIYGIIFYRYYSKRKLRRTMDVRDRARSDLYLAQLRTQSAPNTPGFGPLSPSYSTHMGIKSPRYPQATYNAMSDMEEGYSQQHVEPGTRFVEARPGEKVDKPFTLQPPPIKIHSASPRTPQSGQLPFGRDAAAAAAAATSPPLPKEYVRSGGMSPEPVPVAEGEVVYESVPIPGAYHAS